MTNQSAGAPPVKSEAMKRNLAYYHDKLPEWVEHEGKYALIHDGDLVEFYSSYDDAIKIGYSQFGLDPFLVKQVRVVEQVQCVSRFLEPAAAGW